jgi:hypothetical protein
MKNSNPAEHRTARRIVLVACSTALAAACTASLPQSAVATHVTAPDVPGDIRVPEGNTPFLVGHAVGTQN